jgi:hypothetical protein
MLADIYGCFTEGFDTAGEQVVDAATDQAVGR